MIFYKSFLTIGYLMASGSHIGYPGSRLTASGAGAHGLTLPPYPVSEMNSASVRASIDAIVYLDAHLARIKNGRKFE